MELKAILEKNNYGIDTELCGYPFHITAERNIYNAIRGKYKEFALEACKAFEKKCSELQDIDDLINNAPIIFIQACERTLLEVISDIISVDIYTIDRDAVIEHAFNGDYFDSFVRVYGEYTETYDAIMTELMGAEYSREMRRQNRPRWQSVTIGGSVFSAWSDQLDTAAMNIAEGAAYSAIDYFLNKLDEADAKAKLNTLFKSKSLRIELIDGVYDACFNLHLLLIDMVEACTDNLIEGTISETDARKAHAMINNLVSVNLSDEKRGIFINEIFHLDPYKNEHYRSLIETFGDRDDSIGSFADFHGVNIIEIKNDLLAEYVAQHLGSTEEDAHRCQQLMEARAEEIGLSTVLIEQPQSMITERLEALDLKYRTVDRVVMSTREEADLAREELPKILKIMDSIRRANKFDTLGYERDLLAKRAQIDSFATPVKQKYLEKIDSYLREFDRIFRHEGAFSAGVSREEAGSQRAYDYIITLPVGSYAELDDSKAKLMRYLPEVGVTPEQATRAFDYLSECENRLNMVDGVLFPSREAAALGRQEVQEISVIMQSVTPPDSRSLLPYEKHLIETRERLRAFSTPVKEKYIAIIQSYLERFDKKFRTCGMTVYETREEAAQARTLRYAKTLPVTSYEELDRAKQSVQEFVPLVGISYAQAESTHAYFHQCYLSLNTVDGVVFQTREEADFGRRELAEIREIMSAIHAPTRESLLDYEREANAAKEKLAVFQTDIKNKYIAVIDSYLEKFDATFRQTGTFTKTETREEAAQARALKLVKSIAPSGCSYEDVDKATRVLNETLPDLGITLEQAHEATRYIQSQEDRLNTVDGVLFPSREEAAFGRREYEQIMQLMSGVRPPTKDSLLDYERNLLAVREQVGAFETDVKNKYLALIDEYLQKFDLLFKQTGPFTKAESRLQAAQYRALKLVKKTAPSGCGYAEVDKAAQELAETLPNLGITPEQAHEATRYIQSQEDRLNTVDGVVFSTREETKLAREELVQIQAIMSTVTPPNANSLLSYEAALKRTEEQLSVFTTRVKNKYLGIVRKYLREFDEKFRRVSLIKVCATREEAGRERALKYAKSQTYHVAEDVARVRQELTALLPELGITEAQAEKAFAFLKETEDRLNSGQPAKPKGLFGRFKR